MKKIYSIALLICLGVSQSVSAQVSSTVDVSMFTQFYSIPPVAVVVPTVAELRFPSGGVERPGFLVLEEDTQKIIPYSFIEGYRQFKAEITAQSPAGVSASALVDESIKTSMDFFLPESGEGTAAIILETSKPIYASELQFEFAQNVTLPDTVAVTVSDEKGNAWVAVAKRKMDERTVEFPQVFGNRFEIVLTYNQMLRINNIELIENSVAKVDADTLRFVAQPDYSYRVYFNPDAEVLTPSLSHPLLQNEEDPHELSNAALIMNPLHIPADSDEDGVIDALDTCPNVHNADQEDVDKNGIGDACEDFDKDGIINSLDNCPAYPNRSQADDDGDKTGDECDDSESRLTERYAFIPWAGMGIAFMVLCALFILVGIKPNDVERQETN